MSKQLTLKGISVSEGIEIGKVIIYRTDFDDVKTYSIPQNALQNEHERYQNVIDELKVIFNENYNSALQEFGQSDAAIYETYQLILQDPFFQKEVPASINRLKTNVEAVITQKLSLYEKHFESIDDPYLSERIFDIRGVARKIVYNLLQTNNAPSLRLEETKIIAARELTPIDSIHFHHKSMLGLITEQGGKTSHAAILARSMEVPALVGVNHLIKYISEGTTVVVDGLEGKVILNPDTKTVEKYRNLKNRFEEKKSGLLSSLNLQKATIQNKDIRLLANINDVSELSVAEKYCAEGVGLFRTELPFLAKGRMLNENEQFKIYKSVAERYKESETVIRVLDLGGDKFLPFSAQRYETNPFLGWCSIRVLLSDIPLFKTQLRAMLRASNYGKIKILLPMISAKQEIVDCKNILEEVKHECREANCPFDAEVKIGIMIEVPSAAIMIDELIDEVDFVSIGTNDLIQYTLAVDRSNIKVADYYQPLNKAIVRLLENVSSVCNAKNKEVSICGEIAGDPIYTQLLLSLGINKFSMQPVSIPQVKQILLQTDLDDLEEISNYLKNYYEPEKLLDFLKEKYKTSLKKGEKNEII